MGSKNALMPFVWPDDFTYAWLFNVGDAIGIGDLMYDGGSNLARPADKLATLGTELADQQQFAASFIGLSEEQILSTETNAIKRFTIRTWGVAEMTCVSSTFAHGDLVGIYSDGSNLNPQKVDKVTDPEAAIGVVFQDYSSATTVVRFAFMAPKYCHGRVLGAGSLATTQTLAATGSAIGNAAKLKPGFTYVTGSNNTAGVILPAAVPGTVCKVKNGVATAILEVYPTVGTQINANGNNNVYNMANASVREFVCYNAAIWLASPETIA